jgi:hypothetical protein
MMGICDDDDDELGKVGNVRGCVACRCREDKGVVMLEEEEEVFVTSFI